MLCVSCEVLQDWRAGLVPLHSVLAKELQSLACTKAQDWAQQQGPEQLRLQAQSLTRELARCRRGWQAQVEILLSEGAGETESLLAFCQPSCLRHMR